MSYPDFKEAVPVVSTKSVSLLLSLMTPENFELGSEKNVLWGNGKILDKYLGSSS